MLVRKKQLPRKRKLTKHPLLKLRQPIQLRFKLSSKVLRTSWKRTSSSVASPLTRTTLWLSKPCLRTSTSPRLGHTLTFTLGSHSPANSQSPSCRDGLPPRASLLPPPLPKKKRPLSKLSPQPKRLKMTSIPSQTRTQIRPPSSLNLRLKPLKKWSLPSQFCSLRSSQSKLRLTSTLCTKESWPTSRWRDASGKLSTKKNQSLSACINSLWELL